MSTVTALLKLSDTRTFERYLVVSALVAELATVAMSKVTVSLSANDEDTDSFDDFAAHCRWYRDGSRKPDPETWTTGIYKNGLDLSICGDEYMKQLVDQRFLRWRSCWMSAPSGSRRTSKSR